MLLSQNFCTLIGMSDSMTTILITEASSQTGAIVGSVLGVLSAIVLASIAIIIIVGKLLFSPCIQRLGISVLLLQAWCTSLEDKSHLCRTFMLHIRTCGESNMGVGGVKCKFGSLNTELSIIRRRHTGMQLPILKCGDLHSVKLKHEDPYLCAVEVSAWHD